ncbi:MAG TPA: hypothetical protein ENK85_09010 [Saprospiraceae bacterium]|nr:hypothetical protein [Saprospiraceae bacterium]
MRILALFLVITIVGCSPKISSKILQEKPMRKSLSSVVFYSEKDSIPINAEIIGRIHVGDAGFTTRCSRSQLIENIKEEVRRQGGNAFKVTKYWAPNLWSSCHRIRGLVLIVPEDEANMGDKDAVAVLPELSNNKKLSKFKTSISGGVAKPVFD